MNNCGCLSHEPRCDSGKYLFQKWMGINAITYCQGFPTLSMDTKDMIYKDLEVRRQRYFDHIEGKR